MSIKDIHGYSIYFTKKSFNPNVRNSPPFPMVAILDSSGKIRAAIKFSSPKGEEWRVDNVAAINGWGPTVYRVLMQISGESGLAPTYKHSLQSPEFIVDKSKVIWSKFMKEASIEPIAIVKKYNEPYLNYKFVVKSDFLDIEKSELELEKLILNKYRESKKGFNKLLLVLFGVKEEEKEIFSAKFISSLQLSIKDFLESSVEVHSK
jgi:hypothetical protein